jgi:hypothetical protein
MFDKRKGTTNIDDVLLEVTVRAFLAAGDLYESHYGLHPTMVGS